MSIRARLALLFASTITLLVIATCAATYLVVRSNLRSTASGDATSLARSAAAVEADELSLDRIAGPGARVWLTNASGAVIARSHAAGTSDTTLADVNHSVAAAPGGSTSARVPRPGGGFAIVLLSNAAIDSTLSTLLSTLIAVGIAVAAASALVGALLAGRALQPVERMRRQVDEIPGDVLGRRIAEGRRDELGRLAAAFNRLLARAQTATEQQQRFVADASHELRTPVTALQGHARIVTRAAERGDLAQTRESAQIMAETSARMGRTLAELLALAEGDAGGRELEPVRLDRVAAEACDELRAANESRRIEAELAEATVRGDAGRLGELVRILVDNAVKYSPAEEPVIVTVTDTRAGPELRVRDRGPGLGDDERHHAFDRFFRGAAAQGVAGSGLGLSIAQAIVKQHHATLSLEPASGGGTVAVARFDAAATTHGSTWRE